ncbi:hypothetical protein ACFW3D_23470 [Streptomyces sp. NPDC058864]
MPEHQHSLDGNNRDLTLAELKEFIEAASRNSATSSRPIYVKTSGNRLRKIWIDLSASS